MTPHSQPEPRDDAPAPLQMSADVFWQRYGKYPYILAKLAIAVAIVCGVLWLGRAVSSVLFPLFLSLLIAYLLDPLVDRFEGRRIGRTPAILLIMLVILLAIGVFVAFLYPLIARQVVLIFEKLPGLLEMIETQMLPWLQRRFEVEIPHTLNETITRYGGELKSAAPAVLRKGGDWATGLLTQTGLIVVSLINLVMIPIFIFYFLRDFDRMRLASVNFIPIYCRAFVLHRARLMDVVVGAWFRGQIQVALILAALNGVGLGVVFGVGGLSVFDGVALGVITGVLNVVPYLGFTIGFSLTILVVLIEWTSWGTLIGAMGVLVGVQVLEGYYITPKVVGDKVGLNMVTVIIVLLIGGELAGLMGVLLAIPVTGALKVILPDMIRAYRESTYFRGDAEDISPVASALIDAPPSHPPTLSEAMADAMNLGSPQKVPDQAPVDLHQSPVLAGVATPPNVPLNRVTQATSEHDAEAEAARAAGVTGVANEEAGEADAGEAAAQDPASSQKP